MLFSKFFVAILSVAAANAAAIGQFSRPVVPRQYQLTRRLDKVAKRSPDAGGLTARQGGLFDGTIPDVVGDIDALLGNAKRSPDAGGLAMRQNDVGTDANGVIEVVVCTLEKLLSGGCTA